MELYLFDTIRTLSCLGFIWSLALVCLGKGAIWAAKCQRPWFARKVFKKSIFGLIVVCIVHHICSNTCHQMHMKLEHVRNAHRNTTAQDIADGRQLQTMVIEVPKTEDIQQEFQ